MFTSLVRNFCLVICLCAAAKADSILAYGTCVNPHQESGICIKIIECNYLLNILNTNLTDVNRKFLADSQCGVDGTQESAAKKILVCCPERFRNNRSSNSLKDPTPGNQLPQPGECGKNLSKRILGGNVTEIDEFPWMALIQYKTAPDRFGFYCGGSLINSRYVLTAGHCLKHPDMPPSWELYGVRLGEWDLTLDPDCTVDNGVKDCIEPYVDVRIDYAIAHPSYIPTSKDQFNDIAIIRLMDSVGHFKHLIPICLPVASSIRTKLFTAHAMDVAGWGVTEKGTASAVKLKIMVNVWNVTRCQKTYQTFQMAINSDYQMCAGGEDGIDTCRGDSGGPLMVIETVEKRNVYFAAGVVSYGPRPCGLEGWPGVYTRVGSYMDWIIANMLP
ncbi:serine protease easter [Musca domestica]|uniref:CLIP domain-containing serine protease n=1 Tax=Musca domestica TaxID=7370 RepID=A0A9J7CUU6_MUSDO|nr:serine protease easter [Musca domestica]